MLLTGSLGGTVWHDADGDGVVDAGESKLAGWVVYLDQNHNHHCDADEKFTTSAADGSYVFRDLPPGVYNVAEELKGGWKKTYPAPIAATVGPMAAPPRLTYAGSHAPAYLSDATAADSPLDAGNWPAGTVLPVPGTVIPTDQESNALVRLNSFQADPHFTGVDGHGFSVAVLDTGIDPNHSLFGLDADENGSADRIVYQYDFADDDPDASDPLGHGSNVASIVGGRQFNYSGMAPGVDLIALKVFKDTLQSEWSYVEKALQWVVANASKYNIAAVNMSLGDRGNYTDAMQLYGIDDELAALSAMNVIVVSGAGNEYYKVKAEGVGYPAADPNALAVGAVWDADVGPVSWSDGSQDYTTGRDRIISFSQRSTTLTDIMAPGAWIAGADRQGGIWSLGGTSQAAPHVAGVAALAQQLAVEQLGRRLTPAEFKSLLASTGATIRDGDDESDNVPHTGAYFKRLDVTALGDAIYAMGDSSYFGGHHVVLADGSTRAGLGFGNAPLPIVVPAFVNLQPLRDTGVSQTDNLTRQDNAVPGQPLAFWVGGVYEGATATVYADGHVIGAALAGAGGSVDVESNGKYRLFDGPHIITARQTPPGLPESADSPPLTITVDTTRPKTPLPLNLIASSDSGVSNSDNLTNDNTPTFAVSGVPDGTYYRVFRPNNGVPVSNEYQSGALFTAPVPQPEGTWPYIVQAVDAAGNVSPPTAPLQVTFDTTAWLQPGLPAPGSLDATFGQGGIVVDPRPGAEGVSDLLLQADGKYVVIGSVPSADSRRETIQLARYLPDGRPDRTFGAGGRVLQSFQFSDVAHAAALQSDGKIILAGYSAVSTGEFSSRLDALLVRYNSDGTLDTSFGDGGKRIGGVGPEESKIFEIFDVAVQPNGKIVVAGEAIGGLFGLARFLPDGRLDSSFDGDGELAVHFGDSRVAASALALQSDGKIVGVGTTHKPGAPSGWTDVGFARFNPDGSFDTTFDGDGSVIHSVPKAYNSPVGSVVVQPDGGVVVGGEARYADGASSKALLMRVTAAGALDAGFGAGGVVIDGFTSGSVYSSFNSLALQPDGKIIGAGRMESVNDPRLVVARYLTNGSPDGTFGNPRPRDHRGE